MLLVRRYAMRKTNVDAKSRTSSFPESINPSSGSTLCQVPTVYLVTDATERLALTEAKPAGAALARPTRRGSPPPC